MRFPTDNVSDVAIALEQEVELKADAAKRAISEYKKWILGEPVGSETKRIEMQREVEYVVREYIRLRKRLDELRAQICTSSAS